MKLKLNLLVASVAIAFHSFGQVAMPPMDSDLQHLLPPADERQEIEDPFAPHQPKTAQARKGQSDQNASQPLSSNAIKQRLDSIVEAGVDKYYYSYNSNGRLTLWTYYKWNTSTNTWVADRKAEPSYDANGNPILWIWHTWNTSTNTWINHYKSEYSYDANENQTLNSYYNWSISTNTWIGLDKDESAYDANGNKTLSIDYDWNTSINTWRNDKKYEYSYDVNGNLTCLLFIVGVPTPTHG